MNESLLGFFPKVHLGKVALNFALRRPPPCIGTPVVVVLVSFFWWLYVNVALLCIVYCVFYNHDVASPVRQHTN